MRILTLDNVLLEFQSQGPLLPWLGPAVRGLLGLPLKDRVCRQPLLIRRSRWKECKGCPYLAECPYGILYEPQIGATLSDEFRRRLCGRQDAPRSLIMAPAFPSLERAAPGLRWPMRISLVGEAAARHAGMVLETLDRAGRERGLGSAGAKFSLSLDSVLEQSAELSPDALPMQIEAGQGVVPRLGIGLTGPLFLRPSRQSPTSAAGQSGPGRYLRAPTFYDLFRSAWSTVRDQLVAGAEPIPWLDVRPWTAAARQVPLLEDCFEGFEQCRNSSRHGRSRMSGTRFGAIFGDVPWAFIPWLMWGGLLHVGERRMEGAGGWRLVLNP